MSRFYVSALTDADEIICGCAATCHEIFRDIINAILSGVLSCDGCYTIVGAGVSNDFKFTFVGINGIWEAAFASGSWVVTVAVGTATVYNSNDGTCTGGIRDDVDFDVTLEIDCSANSLNVFVQAGFDLDFSGAVGFTIVFFRVIGMTMDSSAPNELESGDCGNFSVVGSSITINAGFDGTITLSLPPGP